MELYQLDIISDDDLIPLLEPLNTNVAVPRTSGSSLAHTHSSTEPMDMDNNKKGSFESFAHTTSASGLGLTAAASQCLTKSLAM